MQPGENGPMDILPPWLDTQHDLRDADALRRVYPDAPSQASVLKVADHLHPVYRPYIEASPFVLLATRGPAGLDVSPRGDAAGFVQIADPHTLLLPDRRGNNRVDSLRNLLHDPSVALLFLVPGCKETVRVSGQGRISTAPALLRSLAVGEALPRSVLVVRVREVFFQCGRAVLRSKLWSAVDPSARPALPSPGQILAALSGGGFDGAAYDAELPERQRRTLY